MSAPLSLVVSESCTRRVPQQRFAAVTEHAEDHPSRIHRRNAERRYSFRDVRMYRAMYLVRAVAGGTGEAPFLQMADRPKSEHEDRGRFWRKATNDRSRSPRLLGSPSSAQRGLQNGPITLGRRNASTSMSERDSQLPRLLTQRERTAFRQPRNPGDWRLSARVLLELANVTLRPEAPRPPHLLLCHPDSLQLGTRRLS